MKQKKRTKGSNIAPLESNTKIAGNFSAPLLIIYRTSRHKINRETENSNDMINPKYLTDMMRPFHPTATEYTVFSSAQETFASRDWGLGYKISLNKFKKINIILNISTIMEWKNRNKKWKNEKIEIEKIEMEWKI